MKSMITLIGLLLTAALIAAFTALGPLEKTLGENARLVYLHGAWVWAALAAFAAAAVAGAAGLAGRRPALQRWSRALGRTGLLLWITFLPMSLHLMQANWNGLFLAEPRWRTPFTFAVVGILLQAGLAFFPASWAAAANLLYAAALFTAMRGMENVLHPVSPVLESDSLSIRVFFGCLLALLLLAAGQMARGLLKAEGRFSKV
jgi:hypothetical protein